MGGKRERGWMFYWKLKDFDGQREGIGKKKRDILQGMENGSRVSSLNREEKKWRGVGKIWGKGKERFSRDSTWERDKWYFWKGVERFFEEDRRRRER